MASQILSAKSSKHDVDMFGDMEVIESTHGDDEDYESSDDENGRHHSHSGHKQGGGGGGSTSAAVSAAINRKKTPHVLQQSTSPVSSGPGTPTNGSFYLNMNANAKHSYVPSNVGSTPKTLQKTPSTLMRAASMKVLSTTNKDSDEEYLMGTVNMIVSRR
jgi:hypothetical protein